MTISTIDATASRTFWSDGRIRLRAIEPEDWEYFRAWDDDDDAARATYEIPFPRALAGSRRWAELESAKEPEQHVFRWMITTTDGEPVGCINTHDCDPRVGVFSYGVAIAGKHRRRGYAAAAIGLVLRYFFEELRYQKCNAQVFSFNAPSAALHERLGFQPEGRIRRAVYTAGQHHDVLWYGLTREEYMENQGKAEGNFGGK